MHELLYFGQSLITHTVSASPRGGAAWPVSDRVSPALLPSDSAVARRTGMFSLVHQFTALTAGNNPWGGVGCGGDSGEMGSCTAYVQTKSTPFEEVLTAHAPLCLPRCVCNSGECERARARV